MDGEKAKELVREQFGRNASKYVTSAVHAQGDDLALLVEWLEPATSWHVLDIATGGGHVTKALAPHVEWVFSTDLTVEMLEAARGHVQAHAANVTYVVADAERLPFLSGAFDAVTCRIAAHHFPEPQAFVREAARVLKPGGRLLLIDNVAAEDDRLDGFVNELEKLRDESHVRCYRVSEWREWFAAAGLLPVRGQGHELERELERERIRKKTFAFPSWVRRTAGSEEQVARVERHLLEAAPELQEYCGLQLEEDGRSIRSIHIDEWMSVWEKPA